MSDPFASNSAGLDSPGLRHFAVTPDDDTDLAIVPRFLVTDGGAVAMRDADGNDVTWPAGPPVIPFRPARVLATGTTATTIVGVY